MVVLRACMKIVHIETSTFPAIPLNTLSNVFCMELIFFHHVVPQHHGRNTTIFVTTKLRSIVT